MARSLGFYGDGISVQVVFGQSFWLRVLPGGARLVQPRWMPERRILGGGQTGGVSFWPFPNSSGWWRLISSLFLTRTSYNSCKWLLWCLARVGSFYQCASPNNTTFSFLRNLQHPTPVLLPGKSHGWRSLVGYSLWGRWESDTTERLHFHFSLLCIGERNGNPLQSSCLENPRDRGAWWAAVYGVAQRLKRLSSSSSSIPFSVVATPIYFPPTM